MLSYFTSVNLKTKQTFLITIGALIIGLGSAALPFIPVQNDIKDIFVSNNPENDRVKTISNQFSENQQPIILAITSETKFDNLEDFRKLNELSKRVQSLPQIDSAFAITDVTLPKFIETRVVMKPLLLLESSNFKSKYLDKLDIYTDITPLFISKDKTTTSVFLFLNQDITFTSELAQEIKKAATVSGFKNFELLGNEVFENEVKSKVNQDIYRLALIGFILILITFWFFFRSIQVIIFIGWMVAINVNGAILFIWLLDMDFNIMTAVIPTIIAILSITDLNHILHIYKKYESENDTTLRIKKSYNTIKYSLILTSVTTAVGFSIFLLNDVSQIINFGIIAILSIVFALITAWYFAPTYLTLLNTKKSKLLSVSRIQKKLETLIQTNYRVVSTVFLFLFSIATASAIFFWNINYIIYDDLEDGSSLENSYRNFNDQFAGTRQLEIYITGDSLAPYSSEVLLLIDSIENILTKEYNYKFVNSSNSLLKSYNRSYNRGKTDYYNLSIANPKDAWISIQENLPAKWSQTYSNLDYSGIKITAIGPEIMSTTGVEKTTNIKERLQQLISQDQKLDIAGIAVMRDHSTYTISTTIMYGIFISIVLISVIMAINFKSLGIGIIALLVNLFPVFASTSILFACNLHITPAIAMMLSISFGIALDDTIYFLGRLKSENRGLSRSSIIQNVKTITFPVLSTTVILSMSFCALLFSSFSFNITNALIIICTLLIAMLSDLLVLPALLYSIIKKEK
ncbi:MAG: putative RND superfamily exporter protein [Flavobacteriales bacterium]